VIPIKSTALLSFALAVTGCTNTTSHAPDKALGWDTPAMQLGGDRGLPLHVTQPCRKRGCDNDKLFFNPAKAEPGINTIHRGW